MIPDAARILLARASPLLQDLCPTAAPALSVVPAKTACPIFHASLRIHRLTLHAAAAK